MPPCHGYDVFSVARNCAMLTYEVVQVASLIFLPLDLAEEIKLGKI